MLAPLESIFAVSIKKTRPEFWRRQVTCFALAEPAIAMARDKTIEAACHEGWHQAANAAHKSPRLFEVVADGDDSFGFSTETAI